MTDYYVGLISGTSTDGIDAVLATIAEDRKVQIDNACSVAYPAPVRCAVEELARTSRTQPIDLQRAGELNVQLGELFAAAAQSAMSGTNPDRVRAIGSHGQTVLHNPAGKHPFTLQLGSGAVIAERTGIATVVDFRAADIAAGGQGAPLVPAFHNAVFHDLRESRCIVNIGGISNVSYLPANPRQPTLGFDTGPGNTLLDTWIERHKRQPFDQDGEWGASGLADIGLLAAMLADPYLGTAPPKSTGREYFNLDWLDAILASRPTNLEPADVQATLVRLTATTIVDAVNRFLPKTHRLSVCGGGARNPAIMTALQTAANNIPVGTTADLGIDPAWVEAAAFAWLAKQRLQGNPGNLPAVTGARHSAVLGAIYLPPPGATSGYE